jgi:oligosaccharide amylase
MPRSLILGNGTMLATFDGCMQLRDLYYPYVGQEDHTTFGNVHRVGVFVEGRGFSWFSDPAWEISVGYKVETLVGNAVMTHRGLGLVVTLEDSVHPIKNILLRRVHIGSLDDQEKRVRVFFHHDFHIYGDKQKDTAFYEPYTNSVIHYRGKRYFLIGGETSDPQECAVGSRAGEYASVLHSKKRVKSCGISGYAIGKANYKGFEGTWRDAEDGTLGGNTVEQGSVDSTVGMYAVVRPGKETDVTMWLCLGKSLEEVVGLQQAVLEETPERLARNAQNYWKSWVNKDHPLGDTLGTDLIELYKRSLLLIRIHADNRGGIVAAADSDITAFNRDTYTYVWPRDGAFVSMALDQAGYSEVSRRFLEFCARVQMPDGYLLHKYNPDLSLGSSWHPWLRDGEPQLPIQEDETALVICAISQHFAAVQDFEFLQQMYDAFVKKAAQFLCDFREETTGLPLPSYDLWEEHRGIFTYTVSCVIAGLQAAAHIAQILGHYRHAENYQHAADEMRQALLFHLYDADAGCFLKKIKRKDGKTVERDATPDASIMFVWKLGVLPPDDPRVVSTMQRLRSALSVRASTGGIARYANDHYQSVVAPSADIPGNPWIIATLWDAQWTIIRATSIADLAAARDRLRWVRKHANASGILPEQLHPLTGQPLSVAPLTWSHAMYVETILMYVEREKKLRG